MHRRLIASTALALLIGTAFAQLSPEDAKAKCSEFCARLGLTFDASSARVVLRNDDATAQSFFLVATPSYSLVVNRRLGHVEMFTHEERESEIRDRRGRTGRSRFAGSDDAWAAAESLLAALQIEGLERGELATYDETESTPTSHRGRHFMSFWERPHGISSRGNGNRVDIALDRQDGTPLLLHVVRGWSYDAPKIQISQSDAELAASKILGKVVDLPKVTVMYSSGNGAFGAEAGLRLLERRACRVVYCISTDAEFVLVDAENGECLGGGATNASQGAGRRERDGDDNSPRVVAPPLVEIPKGIKDIGLPLGLILLGGACCVVALRKMAR